jgi:iron-sulfur cluster repair protein YtfE (RIC family)
MTTPEITEADLDALLEDIARAHHEPLRRHIADIARLVGEMTAYGDAGDAAVLLEIRQLVDGLAACVEQQLSVEQQTLFPMLRRLQRQTFVSKCHAGMVRSRVGIAERDLARIRGVMVRLRDLGNEILSPHGGCEACHELLGVVADAIANLRDLAVKESEVLFAWAVAREQMLAG